MKNRLIMIALKERSLRFFSYVLCVVVLSASGLVSARTVGAPAAPQKQQQVVNNAAQPQQQQQNQQQPVVNNTAQQQQQQQNQQQPVVNNTAQQQLQQQIQQLQQQIQQLQQQAASAAAQINPLVSELVSLQAKRAPIADITAKINAIQESKVQLTSFETNVVLGAQAQIRMLRQVIKRSAGAQARSAGSGSWGALWDSEFRILNAAKNVLPTSALGGAAATLGVIGTVSAAPFLGAPALVSWLGLKLAAGLLGTTVAIDRVWDMFSTGKMTQGAYIDELKKILEGKLSNTGLYPTSRLQLEALASYTELLDGTKVDVSSKPTETAFAELMQATQGMIDSLFTANNDEFKDQQAINGVVDALRQKFGISDIETTDDIKLKSYIDNLENSKDFFIEQAATVKPIAIMRAIISEYSRAKVILTMKNAPTSQVPVQQQQQQQGQPQQQQQVPVQQQGQQPAQQQQVPAQQADQAGWFDWIPRIRLG